MVTCAGSVLFRRRSAASGRAVFRRSPWAIPPRIWRQAVANDQRENVSASARRRVPAAALVPDRGLAVS
jgi:hypothetical protein